MKNIKTHIYPFLWVICLGLLFTSCGKESSNNTQGAIPEPQFVKEGELTFLKADGFIIKTIDIEVADDDQQRMQGLMYRKSMSDNQGMLFTFQTLEPKNFWMKNTYIPLDIIFMDDENKIVTIGRNAQPLDESGVSSIVAAQYVVEVNGGFCDKYSVIEGDKISFIIK